MENGLRFLLGVVTCRSGDPDSTDDESLGRDRFKHFLAVIACGESVLDTFFVRVAIMGSNSVKTARLISEHQPF